MRHYLVTRKYSDSKDLQFISCDKCHVKVESIYSGSWYKVTFDNQHSDGYDEYGSKDTLDLCPKCILEIGRALEAAGLPVRVYKVFANADEDSFFVDEQRAEILKDLKND